MSQYDMSIAGTNSGTELVAALNSWEGALNSCHSGSTRPSYAIAKTLWVNDATVPWVVYMFDGVDDIQIGTVDPTTNAFTPSISVTPTIVLQDVQAQTGKAYTTGGTSPAFTLTPTPAISANTENIEFDVEFHAASTGTSATLAVSGLTALPLKYRDSTGTLQNVTATQIPAGWRSRVTCDGTYWVLREVPVIVTSIVQDFRLTLTSGTPVTTADVTGATTIYCTPTTGNRISLYDGTKWVLRNSAEFSKALGTLTSGKPYDVFCYDNSGTPTLEFLVWTNDTTRATGLTRQDGVLVKSGDATRRYLGTFYTTSTTTTEDSKANRYLWNYYHRVRKVMQVWESTANWTYTTATYRQANNNTANQLNFVIGVSEEAVQAEATARAANSTGTAVNLDCVIGLDSTTAIATDCQYARLTSPTANTVTPLKATFNGYVTAGKHYLAWLEFSTATGTSTWYGGTYQGINGVILA